MPNLSIILPCYKPELLYLRESISSLLASAPMDSEIIIGLDGPHREEVEDIIHRFQEIKGLATIRLFKLPRAGLVGTLNALIEKSDSKWIARQDSDDLSLPNRFTDQIEVMTENPTIGFCGMQICRCGPGLIPLKRQRMYPRSYRAQLLYSCCINNPIAHPSLLLSREKLGNIRYECVEGAEDWKLYTRLWSQGNQSINLSKIGVLYRVHPKQITAARRSMCTINQMKKATLEAIEASGGNMRAWELLYHLSTSAKLTEIGLAIKQRIERKE